ncbi:hypothetical protein [Embleya sp. NPDC005575]|uniref:hypothetical protein n=1 Tax=Embleya sp. NPDC005575 TaxID=3156892 RepID=UPI0033B2ACE9
MPDVAAHPGGCAGRAAAPAGRRSGGSAFGHVHPEELGDAEQLRRACHVVGERLERLDLPDQAWRGDRTSPAETALVRYATMDSFDPKGRTVNAEPPRAPKPCVDPVADLP